MPRGVPANGKRRPSTAAPELLTVDEGTTEATEDRVPGSADHETPEASTESVSPVPVEEEPTPEQLEIKRLRDELARAHGKRDPELEYEPETPEDLPDNEIIRIHVLEDGLTAQGKILYRGDELEFRVGSAAYKETFDRNGWSWLELRKDEFAQAERFGGRIMFRNGPWPGKTYLDGSFETLRVEKGEGFVSAPSPEELQAAEKARARRAAPRLPTVV